MNTKTTDRPTEPTAVHRRVNRPLIWIGLILAVLITVAVVLALVLSGGGGGGGGGGY